MKYSQEAAYAGSWPDLQCANVSYTGPDSTYAHVLSLTEGAHTLWTGYFVAVSQTPLLAQDATKHS